MTTPPKDPTVTDAKKRRGWCAIAKEHAKRDEDQGTDCGCAHCRRECDREPESPQ